MPGRTDRDGPRANGDIAIGWTRRSRAGWTWLDGGDALLGEEVERYRLEILPETGTARTVEVAVADYLYTAAERTADGATAATSMTVSVRQYGLAGWSMPVTLTSTRSWTPRRWSSSTSGRRGAGRAA